MKISSTAIAYLLITLAFYPHVFADTVNLKNGRSFEGIIKNENGSEITLDIGLGTISFNKSQIGSINRSEGEGLKNEWQRQYFTQGKYVPPGLNDLASDFNGLESLRRSATKARTKNVSVQRRRVALFKELTRRKQEITRIAMQFQSVNPEHDVGQYNNLVRQQNRKSSRVIVIQNALQADNEKATTHRETIANYQDQLASFKTKLDRRKADFLNLVPSEQITFFFSKLDQRINEFSTDFQNIEVPHDQRQEHMIVTVRLNDAVEGRFLLDTGATFVTLSNEIAQRLNINISQQNQIPITLANGSKAKAQPVVLKTVQVGDARVNGVVAMVFPEPPNQGVDGLLGMTFLREFIINLDPVNNKLVFKKFDPN